MDVRCPQCSTLYEIDDTQVRTSVVTLKCSQCQHVFRFESKTSFIQENQRRWMVRSDATGDILYLTSFEALHQWIMEQRVKKTDEISRTGNRWVKLEEIGEFMPVFQVVESISSIAGAAAEAQPKLEKPTPPKPEAPKPTPEPVRERVRTSLQYGEATEEVTRRERPSQMTPVPVAKEPAPSAAPAQPEPETPVVPEIPLETHEVSEPWSIGGGEAHSEPSEFTVEGKRSSLTPVLVLCAIGLIGGGAYLWQFERELVNSWIEPGAQNRAVVKIAPERGHDAGVAVEEGPDARERVGSAYVAAFAAQVSTEAYTWDQVVQASRPGFDNALGVATVEAENWAEGGGVKESLSAAKRALERGSAKKAKTLYKEVLKHEPRNTEALTGLGWASVEVGEYDQAIDHFRRSISINRRHADAYIGLGTAERQRGNPKAAYDAYDLYLGRAPKGPKASIARYQMDQLKKQLGL